MTDVHNTTDVKTTSIPEQQTAGPGCAHLTGLPVPSPMSDEQLEEAWTTGLRARGRRVTKQRLAVLHAVQDHPHSTAETIVQAVRERIPAITVQSVYVILADLTDIDLLRKFEPPGTPALYETRTGDNHHHAFCVRCGKVEDVDCAVGSAPLPDPQRFPRYGPLQRRRSLPGRLHRLPDRRRSQTRSCPARGSSPPAG